MFEELLNSRSTIQTDALRKVNECVMRSVKEDEGNKNLM